MDLANVLRRVQYICSNQMYVWSEIRELDHAIQFYTHLNSIKKNLKIKNKN